MLVSRASATCPHSHRQHRGTQEELSTGMHARLRRFGKCENQAWTREALVHETMRAD